MINVEDSRRPAGLHERSACQVEMTWHARFSRLSFVIFIMRDRRYIMHIMHHLSKISMNFASRDTLSVHIYSRSVQFHSAAAARGSVVGYDYISPAPRPAAGRGLGAFSLEASPTTNRHGMKPRVGQISDKLTP